MSAMPVWRRADQIAASPSQALKGSKLSLTVPEKTTGSCTFMTTAWKDFADNMLDDDGLVFCNCLHSNKQASPAYVPQSLAAIGDGVFR